MIQFKYPSVPNSPPKLRLTVNVMYGTMFDMFMVIAALYIILDRDTLPFLKDSLFLTLLLAISLIILGSALFAAGIISWKKNDLDHRKEGE